MRRNTFKMCRLPPALKAGRRRAHRRYAPPGSELRAERPIFGGTLIAYWGQSMRDNIGCYSPYDNMGCFDAYLIYNFGIGFPQLVDAAEPALADLTPGSQFLSNLNANTLNSGVPENFKQAAIIGDTPQRWLITRVVAEWVYGALCPGPGAECCNPEDACGERTVALATEIFYDIVEAVLIIELIEDWIDGDVDWREIDYLATILLTMDAIDWTYDYLIDLPGDGTSDGLVQGPSQYYPASNAVQYTISGADSHSAALRSPYDHSEIYAALSSFPFYVPTQASCGFAVSNSPDSFNGNAGTGSFAVTTGGGCNWSAVSQAPWISITSGVNGTSSGTVGFSVAANSVTIPRSGTVQVGNGSSSTLFTVNQGGACLVTLSEGPEVAVPAAGTSSTVQVTIPTDCPWSAVSDSSWLTITSGASGTGPGSFTWTAAANTGNSDRTGAITVMNQTLAVVDGISVGTPSIGTVTISGSEQSDVYNLCRLPADPCPQRYYESGSVSVTVAGMTFTVGYSGSSSTASSLASALANGMNYPLSPISATVSGSTITIVSAINGAATNYPLVTSETFSPYCGSVSCFSSPAFTATASGPNLTGGTN